MDNQDTNNYAQNKKIGRGVNMGNMLEAARDGSWSEVLELKPEYFKTIRAGGFDSVRIPIRWSDYAAQDAPYTIEPGFFARVDGVLNAALDAGLAVVMNMHHYEEIFIEPITHQPRLLGMWQQIAQHYASYPPALMFEVLNEAHSELSNPIWNPMADEAVKVIRANGPFRTIILGPSNWNGIAGLEGFEPPDAGNLILTVHYYLPMPFTHQGAYWVTGSDKWLGTSWTGSAEEQQALIRDFDLAQAYAQQRNLPIFLGEFGAYEQADIASRARWTEFVARQAEARGWSFAYWEFCAGFGVYNPRNQEWRQPLLKALVP